MYLAQPARSKNIRRWPYWLVAIIVVLAAGVVYRATAVHYKLLGGRPMPLPVPLEKLPVKIEDWVGEDLYIRSITKDYMEKHFADDFLSRRYVSRSNNAWVDVYIVYCSSRPAGMLGHRPGVCYPANGWVHDSVEQSHFTSQAGHKIPCLINRLHRPAPRVEEIVVLNFYVLNGQVTSNENDFAGLLSRRPSIDRNPARYVAQVQITSALENAVRAAARDMADILLDYFPGRGRKVPVAEYTYTIGGVPE